MIFGTLILIIWLPLAIVESVLRFFAEVLGAIRYHAFWEYDYRVWLKEDLVDCDSILELGCGSNSPLLQVGYGKKTHAIDIWRPYIDQHNAAGDYATCTERDVLKYRFPVKAFDAVVICDVMEHLDRGSVREAELFKQMERSARKKVIIFTPNGYIPNDHVDGDPYQEHVSAWEPSDYTSIGYKVRGTHGWRWIYGKAGLPARKPIFLWAIVGMLTLPLMYRHPEWAAHSYAVKEIK